jgi:predicted ester cyclase
MGRGSRERKELSVEQNLRMVDAAFEAINDQDWDHLWALHMDNIVMFVPDLPDPVKGREAVQGRLQAYAEALPDLSWKRVRGFGQGEWVCVELIISGTHKGPLRHGVDRGTLQAQNGGFIPPTGRRIELRACVTYKMEGSEIAESHIYYDQFDFLRQLGFVP